MLLNVDQNVENVGVAFVKKANITIDILKKKNLTTIIYEKQARKNKPKDEQSQGRTDFCINTAR